MHVRTGLLLLPLLAALVAACGAQSGAPAATPDDLPFEGRETKVVLAALPNEDRAVLEAADRLVLHALHPYPVVNGKLSPQKERLHSYGILGSADITTPHERRKLIEALYRGLQGEDAGPAQCFNPRHAVSAFRGSRRIDFVICFECTWVHVHGGSGAAGANRLLFSQSVSPVFEALFKAYGLEKHKD